MKKTLLVLPFLLFINGCGVDEEVEVPPEIKEALSEPEEPKEEIIEEPANEVPSEENTLDSTQTEESSVEPQTQEEFPVSPLSVPDNVSTEEIEIREGVQYLKDSDTPYTGTVFKLHDNGEKEMELNLKDGKPDGVIVTYYGNGQKKEQSNFKDGKPADGEWFGWHENGQMKVKMIIEDGETISEEFWNSEGEQVDSSLESEG
jgi:antitoxin component YwqK of YwqJK toxin-antitoxin module|tara:strand:- start:101 stop:709 length:609 start_codon:yes stop_codon:yes gene_type:complete